MSAMTPARMWTRRGRRWLAFGLGVTAAHGAGCQSPGLAPAPPVRPSTADYPGLGPAAVRQAAASSPQDGVVVAAAVSVYATPPVPSPQPVGGVTPSAAPAMPGAADTIDLGAALRLAGVGNPTIQFALELVREALAAELAARALVLPSVAVGGNVRVHRGVLQAGTGQLRQVDSQSLYLGAGAGATGAGTVAVPGVRLFAHLGDAVYEPLAARQRVAVGRSDARAVQNAVLRDVAVAYLALAGAEARLTVLRQGETDLAEVVRVTAVYAVKGQGRAGDADRAAANAGLLRRDIRRAEEDVAVASARLCRLLSLDPARGLRTPGGPVEPFRLVAEEADLEALVAAAVRTRPEVAARAAETAEAQTRVRQERVRPWLPTVSVGYSGGGFGGGSNRVASDFGPLQGRSDFDVVAVWTAENLGVGVRARVRRAEAGVGQAVAEYDLAVNVVRREVSEALATARAAARQTDAARSAVAIAEEGFTLESERIRQGQGRPLEVLDSFRQLLESRQELARAVVAFDTAQFRLYVAVGSSPLAVPAPP